MYRTISVSSGQSLNIVFTATNRSVFNYISTHGGNSTINEIIPIDISALTESLTDITANCKHLGAMVSLKIEAVKQGTSYRIKISGFTVTSHGYIMSNAKITDYYNA